VLAAVRLPIRVQFPQLFVALKPTSLLLIDTITDPAPLTKSFAMMPFRLPVKSRSRSQ
jgi:hypothetical protein